MRDLHQRELALNTAKSFIIQAPAGSGKTQILIERYLSLLSIVDNPCEILAITFTRKAAAEMSKRLEQALLEASKDELSYNDYTESNLAKSRTLILAKKVMLRDRQLKWDIINNLNQLRIQTIDSFFLEIVRYAPIISGINSEYDITNNPDLLYAEAAQEVIEILLDSQSDFDDQASITNAEYQKHLINLLTYLDNDQAKLINLFVKMLHKRDQWLPQIINKNDLKTLKINLENNLQNIITGLINKIKTYINDNFINAYSEFDFNTIDSWLRLADMLLTKKNTWRKKLEIPLEKFKIVQSEKFRLLLIEIRNLPHSEYSEKEWLIMSSLIVLLPFLSANLKLIFRKKRKVDYVEIATLAMDVMNYFYSMPERSENFFVKNIKHVLIDEFQDTSNLQVAFLKCITSDWSYKSSNTLFLVGDPMQSIYSFRYANFDLFKQVAVDGIGGIKLQNINLITNFRSSKEIIEWVNILFSSILKNADIDQNYNLNLFVKSMHFDAKKITHIDSQIENNSVEIANLNQEINDENKESTEHLNNIFREPSSNIKVEIVYNNSLNKKDYERNETDMIIKYVSNKINNSNETTAILLRNKSHAKRIIEEFNNLQIDYISSDIELLATSIIVQELMLITEIICDFFDIEKILILMRIRFFQTNLLDIIKISNLTKDSKINSELNNFPYQKNNTNYQNTIEILLQAKKLDLMPSTICVINSILNLLELIMDSTNLWNSISNILKKIWHKLIQENTDKYLPTEKEMEYAKIYMYHLMEYEAENNEFDINNFFNYVKSYYLPDKYSSTMAIKSDHKLHIMTIHKSKGLEFDNVILPYTHKTNSYNQDNLFISTENINGNGKSELLIAPLHISNMSSYAEEQRTINRYIARKERKKMHDEITRLLYVALTRARKSLYVTATINNKRPIKKDSLLYRLKHIYCAEFF